MRASRSLPLYSILLLIFSTVTLAWPWPRWLPELDALVVRDDGNTTTSATQTTSATSASETSNTTIHPTTDSSSTSGSASASTTGTHSSDSKSKTSFTTKTTSSISINPVLPAGGISLITPAIDQGSTYVKIGQSATFVWNMTSLQVTPTALNILATCTQNKQLYTIAMNQTVTNATGSVVWDTGAYQATAVQNPLLTETYTLIIYDAGSAETAPPSAGFLATFDSYSFGMYIAQPYTPLSDFQCATCSGAMGDMERKALGMVIGMGVITVLSFTWFTSGLGVIW